MCGSVGGVCRWQMADSGWLIKNPVSAIRHPLSAIQNSPTLPYTHTSQCSVDKGERDRRIIAEAMAAEGIFSNTLVNLGMHDRTAYNALHDAWLRDG